MSAMIEEAVLLKEIHRVFAKFSANPIVAVMRQDPQMSAVAPSLDAIRGKVQRGLYISVIDFALDVRRFLVGADRHLADPVGRHSAQDLLQRLDRWIRSMGSTQHELDFAAIGRAHRKYAMLQRCLGMNVAAAVEEDEAVQAPLKPSLRRASPAELRRLQELFSRPVPPEVLRRVYAIVKRHRPDAEADGLFTLDGAEVGHVFAQELLGAFAFATNTPQE